MLKVHRLQLVATPHRRLVPRRPIAAGSSPIAPRPPLRPDPSLRSRLRASRRVSDFPRGGGGSLSGGAAARNWSRAIDSAYGGGREDDDGEDGSDEDEDRSLDLLVRFVQNVFRKISRRARKAVRSVLPVSISTQLGKVSLFAFRIFDVWRRGLMLSKEKANFAVPWVSFSVNGVLILAFLWILKAFLEVVCTLGSVVFVSILLIRGVWSGVTYMQENRSYKMNEADDDHRAWATTQPVT